MSVNGDGIASRSQRLILIDAFRFLCVLATATFHVWMLTWDETSTFARPYWLFHQIEWPNAFLFNRGGVWIAMTSFFLFGYHDRLGAWRLVLFFLGGLGLQWTGADSPEGQYAWGWGVFSLLFVAYAFLMVVQWMPKRVAWGLLGVCSLFGFIPHSMWQEFWGFLPNGIYREAMIGAVSEEGLYSGWFVFPWLSALIFAFSAGRWMHGRAEELQNWRWLPDSLLVGALSLGLAMFFWRDPDFVLGASFNKSIFWVDSLTYGVSVLVPVLIARVSLLGFVQNSLARSRPLSEISKMRWSQDFWLCYLYHFGFLFAAVNAIPQEILLSPLVLQSLPFVVILVTEFFVRTSIPAHRQGWISKRPFWLSAAVDMKR